MYRQSANQKISRKSQGVAYYSGDKHLLDIVNFLLSAKTKQRFGNRVRLLLCWVYWTELSFGDIYYFNQVDQVGYTSSPTFQALKVRPFLFLETVATDYPVSWSHIIKERYCRLHHYKKLKTCRVHDFCSYLRRDVQPPSETLRTWRENPTHENVQYIYICITPNTCLFLCFMLFKYLKCFLVGYLQCFLWQNLMVLSLSQPALRTV